jgi:hypothetical protein
VRPAGLTLEDVSVGEVPAELGLPERGDIHECASDASGPCDGLSAARLHSRDYGLVTLGDVFKQLRCQVRAELVGGNPKLEPRPRRGGDSVAERSLVSCPLGWLVLKRIHATQAGSGRGRV